MTAAQPDVTSSDPSSSRSSSSPTSPASVRSSCSKNPLEDGSQINIYEVPVRWRPARPHARLDCRPMRSERLLTVDNSFGPDVFPFEQSPHGVGRRRR